MKNTVTLDTFETEQQVALAEISRPTNTAPPTMDEDPILLEYLYRDYPDWTKKATRVLSGPLPNGSGPGRPFRTAGEAGTFVIEKYGRYVERIRAAEAGGRWAYRLLLADFPCNRLAA